MPLMPLYDDTVLLASRRRRAPEGWLVDLARVVSTAFERRGGEVGANPFFDPTLSQLVGGGRNAAEGSSGRDQAHPE